MTGTEPELGPDAVRQTRDAFTAPRLSETARERMLEQALATEGSAGTPLPRPANTGMRWALVAAAAATVLVVATPLVTPLFEPSPTPAEADVSQAGMPEPLASDPDYRIHVDAPVEVLTPSDPAPLPGDLRFVFLLGGDHAVSIGAARILSVDDRQVEFALADIEGRDALGEHSPGFQLRLAPYDDRSDQVELGLHVMAVEADWLHDRSTARIIHSAGDTRTSDPLPVRVHPNARSSPIDQIVVTIAPDEALTLLDADQRVLADDSVGIPVVQRDHAYLEDDALLFAVGDEQVLEIGRFDVEPNGVDTVQVFGTPREQERIAHLLRAFEPRLVPAPADGRTVVALGLSSGSEGPHDVVVRRADGTRQLLAQVDVLEAGTRSWVDAEAADVSKLLMVDELDAGLLLPRQP